MATWFTGQVIRGHGQGRILGFPTANIKLGGAAKPPAPGIYVCWARLGQNAEKLPAVLHAGPRPTFNDPKTQVEVHLLDFPDQDLYGKTIAFKVVEKLRGVLKFNSIEELKTAMANDCKQAKALLAKKNN